MRQNNSSDVNVSPIHVGVIAKCVKSGYLYKKVISKSEMEKKSVKKKKMEF